MASNRCMNTSCPAPTSLHWTKGWPLGSAGFANLCLNCGSAYENLVFCDTYHSEEAGWRDCSFCGKRIHCGCIVSKSMFECLDYGGIGCTGCVKRSRLGVIRRDEISNGFDAVTGGNVGLLRPASVKDQVVGNGINEEKLLQLCNIMEANEPDHFQQSQRVDRSASPTQNRGENLRNPFGEVGSSFFNMNKIPVNCQPSVGSFTYSKLDTSRPHLELKDMKESLTQPSLSITLGVPLGTPNFVVPCPGSAAHEDEKSILPFQQGQRSRPIFPKLIKTGTTVNSEARKGMAPLVRIARPPAEGRGKNQLLPRYWPRITDQELEQLSGDLNSTIVPLFEKVLSASDAGRIGRLVLPKACAEAYFPPISQSEGLPVKVQDVKGNEWTFQFRFWPNNNSRMYVLEGVTPCIQSMQLRAGDTVTFSRIDPGGQLVMGFRKATNSTDVQDAKIPTLSNGSHSGDASFSRVFQNLPSRAGGDTSLHKSENFGGMSNHVSGQQPILTMEKKGARNIGSKSKRLLMHSEDALELRLTWEEAQDLLRPPPSANPTIVTIDDHEFEEYDEPPVFGKRTIFTARPTGEQKQWAQCDDCSKWRRLPVDVLLPPKWSCSDNVWDLSRCTCSAPEEISTKEQENLLRASKDFKKRKIVKSQKSIQELEPSGLDALASAAVLGDSIADLHPDLSSQPICEELDHFKEALPTTARPAVRWPRTLKLLSIGLGLCLLVLWLFDVFRLDELACPHTTVARWVQKPAPVNYDEYHAMIERIKGVQATCGQLCNSSLRGSPSKYFDNIRVSVDCAAIFKDSRIDASREQSSAPQDLPSEFWDDFTLHGRFPFRRYPCSHYDAAYLAGKALRTEWPESLLNEWKAQALMRVLEGTYGIEPTNVLIDAVASVGMKGKRCLVIGSEIPWVEAVLLAAGASSIVTLEYGQIHSTHPQVTTMVPSEFVRAYLNNTLGTFDSVVTFSSVEHAGLGRYGDALLPWGDLLAIARGWCVTKPKGDLVIAVPSGPDELMFNAHRRYGPVRYPYLAANWKQENMFPAHQPVYVFTKQDPVERETQ